MEYAAEIANQGFGYVLFVGTWPVIWYLYRRCEKSDERNRLLSDTFRNTVLDLNSKYYTQITSLKESDIHSLDNVKQSLDNIQLALQGSTTILQNIQNLINMWKRS